MKREQIAALLAQFEAVVHRTDDGVEFWLARELQELLGYTQWKNFEQVIERAQEACRAASVTIGDHFADVGKMVEVGSGAQREIPDIALTRYACYLIAQNGDPRKDPIAFAQTYFAVQTRAQELIIQRLAERERLEARKRLTESERRLSGVIFERVEDEGSFARIRSKGDAVLFGGLTTASMKQKLAVPSGRALADFLPTITIKAKDFANELTVFNTETHDLTTEAAITDEHLKNNEKVREVLLDRGIRPEALKPAEDLKKLERRVASEERRLAEGREPRDE